jgi:hypothetical protein
VNEHLIWDTVIVLCVMVHIAHVSDTICGVPLIRKRLHAAIFD